MPTPKQPSDEDEERVRENTETWDEQKDWVVDDRGPEIAWETAMQTVVDAFTEQVSFEEGQVELQPSGVTFPALVAANPQQRAVGMTGRAWSEDLQAMLFVLPESMNARFATKDSPDMLVAFFDADGAVLALEQLTASGPTVVEAVGARLVLEFDPTRIDPAIFEGQKLVFTTSM